MEQQPHFLPDGTHVIPMFAVRCRDYAAHEGAIGEVRWSPEEGVTYSVKFPGVDVTGFAEVRRNTAAGLGAGTVSNFSRDAEWTAKTIHGGEIKLFATTKQPESTHTSGTLGCTMHSTVKGQATLVSVELPHDSELAFWHDTVEGNRLSFLGFDTLYWPERESNRFSVGEGENQSWHETWRCSLTLSEEPLIRIVSGGPRIHTSQLKYAWLVLGDDAPTDDWSQSADCRAASSFLSFILGVRTPFLWRDNLSDRNCLSRVYYGWQKVKTNRPFMSQPLPLSGVEAFQHGRAVIDALPGLFKNYVDLHKTYDLDWVVGLLWGALDAFVEDQLVLACVCLERFVAAYREPSFWTEDQGTRVREALIAALEKTAREVDLDKDKVATLKKQIPTGHMTNADKTIAAFKSARLQLTDEETKAIKVRNECFHGRRTLKPNADAAEMNEEMRTFDAIRMVIYKAVLSLLDYEGPYVDYAERPFEGNFPVKMMRHSSM